MKTIPLLQISLVLCALVYAEGAEPAGGPPKTKSESSKDDVAGLYTQNGTDPSFQSLLDDGTIPVGNSSNNGVKGSKISIDEALRKHLIQDKRPLPQDIGLHTLCNTAIRRKDFGKWTRWYQEDDNTQIFRLFQGETNVHNTRPLSARVEAFSLLHWKQGLWHEWSGTYTIIKPHRAAIFQAKNGGAPNWAVQLDMSNEGDVIFAPRRAKEQIIATNMTGKPFHLRVRDNGLDFEVYLDGKKVGTGSWARPEGETSFRWGMYLGEHPVEHEAMILVTGATFQ